MSKVVLEHLHCWYGPTHAVDDVNLVVEDGELCVLLGPTGCGKTSTLRMIAGFVRPASGDIYLDGQRINDLYPGDRNIAMIFQSYALYPHMTVREQFAFPLKASRMSAQEIKERIQETADFLHMHEFLDRYPGELSAGQQQRVAVGRALIRRPKLFLMDEPLSQLDARLRVEMRATLRRLQQDLGITTIYVTHDQLEAQSVADKIVVMNLGRIQQIGSSLEIYGNPANLFVAGFIGSPPMNFLDCHLEQREGQVYVCNDNFAFPLRPDLARRVEQTLKVSQTFRVSQQLVLGIRPEHIRLSPEAKANAIPTEVYVLEPQSNELVVDLKLGDLILKARGDKREMGFRPQLSQQVWMEFQQEHLHLFDKDSEDCII
ncbi:MAG: ABC transporter ATP-binding protein [Chloroflexi bacterium]|nr:ABC transporter ATP-binding protein [Chloroflexota bacterium]